MSKFCFITDECSKCETRSELRLEPGSDPNAMYHVGQVVKCRVIGSNATSRRIKLSLIIQPPRFDFLSNDFLSLHIIFKSSEF